MENRLGEYLQSLRFAKGLTTRQLADIVGCKNPTISRFETGQRVASLDRLWRIVKELGGDFGHALFLLCLDAGVPEEEARAATTRTQGITL